MDSYIISVHSGSEIRAHTRTLPLPVGHHWGFLLSFGGSCSLVVEVRSQPAGLEVQLKSINLVSYWVNWAWDLCICGLRRRRVDQRYFCRWNMGKPRGLRTARKHVNHRRENRWADNDYKKAHLGTRWKANPFGGASHAKGIVLEKVCIEPERKLWNYTTIPICILCIWNMKLFDAAQYSFPQRTTVV